MSTVDEMEQVAEVAEVCPDESSGNDFIAVVDAEEGEVAREPGELETVEYSEEEFAKISQLVATRMHQIWSAEDRVAWFLVNPLHEEALTRVIRSLPEEICPVEASQNVQIFPDERIAFFHIVTGREVARQFLENRYGPRERGGTGLIPRIQAYLESENSPITITTEWLWGHYLDEVAEKVTSKIITPGTAFPVGIPRIS
jgi:hypothetical protein